MTFQDLVQFMRTKLTAVDVSGFDGHAAYQFNVRGEGEGAFYVEIADGNVNVEGYEYYDRDVIFECDSTVLVDIAEGKITAEDAVAEGKLSFEGDLEKALAYGKLIASAKKTAKPVKKAAAPKADKPAKKAAAPKAEKKAAAPKTEKAEAPKAAEKTAAPKAEKKTARKAKNTK